MQSYDVFAPFYDAVQGDRAEHAAYLRSLIEKHHAGARTVLELACGTGSVLKHLGQHYTLTGVDLSAQMLVAARAKVPEARLLRHDMTRLHLQETFDAVLCVYDSINHLLEFEAWEAVFDRAHEHLNAGGIFIFDINTERQLAALERQPPWTHWFGDDELIVMDVKDAGERVSLWSIRIFEHRGGSDYRLHAVDIPETSFSAERIRTSLDRRYRRVWRYDQRRSRPTSSTERLHFVCRK